MKCSIVLATIACVLSVTSASLNHHKVEKAHSDVMSYVAENMGAVPMMRSNRDHLDCYNGFIPMINMLAQKAKDESNACVANAMHEKDAQANTIDRSQVEAEVKKITDSLHDCSVLDGLDYFVCLQDNAEANRQIMETIKNMSKKIIEDNATAVTRIHDNEDSCIMNAVDNAKNKSDAAFVQLKSCIRGEATFEAPQ
ncbi:protein TsetseEP-like [Eupeodes corollae]|uniref:protein TsetseEP-like n=1 Tax=Eupeodes corollae TaxID=290404 RepID=UPI002492F37E|nr:protein TsetseEP-like [Eupeodes corollae]